MGSSVIRELLKLTSNGYHFLWRRASRARSIPLKEFQAACNYVLENHGAQALQYSTTEAIGRSVK